MTIHSKPRKAGGSLSVFATFVKRVAARLSVVTAVMFAFGVPASGAFAAGASSPRSIPITACTVLGTTGLTAKEVATGNLTGVTVTAAGCNVGIYVPPGSKGLTISHVTVTGAKDEGILVQNATDINVMDSTVDGNGTAPTPNIAFDNALELIGTSNSTVKGNTVTGNFAGGIGVADDGPTNPGGPKPGVLSPANGDTISENSIANVYGGCSIVFSSRNPGAGITGGSITGNTLTGAPGKFGPHGPVLGNIVVATAGFGASLSGVDVTGNKITGAGLPGIIVHADAPKSTVSDVSITHNTLSGDDWLTTDGPPVPAGIVIAASPIPPPISPVVTGTSVNANSFGNEFYDVWSSGADKNGIGANNFTVVPGGAELYSTPTPGSGYWEVASDGGVFNFGTAGFYGSMGGKALNAPVVGITPTLDQGGYWEVASDGGVFSFGDATFYGSMGGKALNAPVVGIAPTPYVASASPGGTPSPAGKGYWEVSSDGGVFAFGDATFYGSMGGKSLNAPVVGIAATPNGKG
ncbi:MAG: right-handed parallel beta-helix repeat-containing protein, partial [Acidimicrobiales bacterium]